MKILILVVACILCPDVFAGVFDVIPTDKSKQYLSIIFGSSIGSINLGHGNFNQTLSLMFEQFNFIIVTFGSIILGYTVVMSTINTAREGEALGKKMSAWIIMRSITGMLCMVPSPTSGYSVVQMTVMWVVLNGIGAANSVWNVVLQQLSAGISTTNGISVELAPAHLSPLAQSVIQSKVCLYSMNNTLAPFLNANSGSPFAQYGPVQIYTVLLPVSRTPSVGTPTVISRSAKVAVGLQGAAEPFNRLCGSFTVQTELNSSDTNNTFNLATLDQRLTTKINALSAMFDAVDPAAQLLASGIPNSALNYNGPDPGYVYAAAKAYISQISQLATGLNISPGSSADSWEAVERGSNNRITGNLATLKSYGWIHAGSYYYLMTQASREAVDPETKSNAPLPQAENVATEVSENDFDSSTQLPNNGWPTIDGRRNKDINLLLAGAPPALIKQFNTNLGNAFDYWLLDRQMNVPPNQGITLPMASIGSTGAAKWIEGILRKLSSIIQTPVLEFFMTLSQPLNKDPLLSLGGFGTILMIAAELGVLLTLLATSIVSLTVSSASCMNPLAWTVNFLFTQLMPLVYGAVVLLWTSGATLGIYLPLVPYIIFTSTAFGWIIAVIEAIVGAPLLALGLVHPSGGELGKSAGALVILANVFLRPTLMIFGLALGGGLLKAGIALINFGFLAAVGQATLPSMFSFLAILMMYMFLVMALVNKSFSLIYMLPNQIMRWMGGPTESFDPNDVAKEAKTGFSAGASKVQAGSQEVLKHYQNSVDNEVKSQEAKAAADSQAKQGGGAQGAKPRSSSGKPGRRG